MEISSVDMFSRMNTKIQPMRNGLLYFNHDLLTKSNFENIKKLNSK